MKIDTSRMPLAIAAAFVAPSAMASCGSAFCALMTDR